MKYTKKHIYEQLAYWRGQLRKKNRGMANESIDEAEGDAIRADELTRRLAVSFAQAEEDLATREANYNVAAAANMHVGTFHKSAIGDVQSYEISGDKLILNVKRTRPRTPATGCMKAGEVLQVLTENPEKRVMAAVRVDDPLSIQMGRHDELYPVDSGDYGQRSGFWLRVG